MISDQDGRRDTDASAKERVQWTWKIKNPKSAHPVFLLFSPPHVERLVQVMLHLDPSTCSAINCHQNPLPLTGNAATIQQTSLREVFFLKRVDDCAAEMRVGGRQVGVAGTYPSSASSRMSISLSSALNTPSAQNFRFLLI